MYSLLPALVSGLFLGYGLYVLSSRGFSRISLSFLALCLASFGWQGTWAVLFQTTDPQLADRLIRAGYLVIIFLPTCLYHFVAAVLGPRTERRWLLVSYALALALAGLNLATDLFVAGHHHYFFGFYPQAGPLHWMHVVQAGVVVGRGIWLCHRTAQASAGERGRRTRLLGLALVIYLMAAVDYLCNYGIAMYPPGVGFITASLGIIAYATSRYDLMNPAEMAASVAHEMRTPLACIRMRAELLNTWLPALDTGYRAAIEQGLIEQPQDSPDITQLSAMVREITRQIDRSNAIIDLILASTRTDQIDPGSFHRCSMFSCIHDALESYPFHPRERPQVRVTCRADFEFLGSEDLMTYVLFNLLKNALFAIRAQGHGDIQIRIGLADAPRTVLVKDTGSGIRPEDMPRIFESFFSTKRLQGAGLGLPFCRKVMHAFGGSISCESVEGRHTSFYLVFPALASDHQAGIRPPDSFTS